MQCTNCAAEVPRQKKFCGHCGAAVVRRCLACGAANPVVNKFCSDCGTKLRADSRAVVPALRDSRPIERRQLTVLFCDLVGSTALSARLDPEDFSAIISGYRRCITETVDSFDGFVARHHGDGAMVFFGYPQAHEDDAERAVQASLALVQAVSALPAKQKLSARVGIATGVALVGDMSDSAISEEHGILGDAPNLAARLQSLAQPGGVIISGRTKTIAGPQFEYLDLGKVEIKGLEKPVAAWQVAGKTTVTSRSHALESGDLLPLIGRDEQMELLLRRWKQAKCGEGQVVSLSGEAGIGKSRLTVALLEQLAREPHIRLCVISARRSIPIARSILSSAR